MNTTADRTPALPLAGDAAATPRPVTHATDRVTPTRHVAHIDGLRALAVLAVIAYHLDERWLPGGFGGVDIFFAISGYVVSASVGAWNKGGVVAFLPWFYARRMQRIVPALLACLLVTALASKLLVPSAWLSHANETTGLYALFGFSNYYLANHRENYFSPAVDYNPYMHTWSLGVEEQFYLVFPLLFFAWTRGRRWRVLSVALFAIAFCASIARGWQLGRTDPTASFYLITTRLFELAAGVLLFQLLDWRERRMARAHRAPWLATAGAWLSAAALGAGLLVSRPGNFPFPGALLPVLGTLGLLACLHGRGGGVLRDALGSGPATWIGRLSYSLYLWHWPVFVLFRWTCGLDSVAARIAATGLTFALAMASFRWLEQPLRYSARLRAWPRVAVVALGLASIGGAYWLSMRIIGAPGSLSLSTVTRHADDWYPHSVLALPGAPQCYLQTQVARAGSGSVGIYTPSGCPQPATPPQNIFVLGDSHAAAYLTMLTEHALRSGATIVVYSNENCTFASLQPEREQGACPERADAAIKDMIARGRPGDVVFLAALRLARLSSQYSLLDEAKARESMSGPSATARRAAAENALVAQLAPLAGHGMRMIIDAPKPIFRAPPFRCADWFDAGNPVCAPGLEMPRDDLERYRRPVFDSLQRIAGRVPALRIWDPFPLLCPGSSCSTFRDGKPLFFDGDHLSAHATRLLAVDFERVLRDAAAMPAGG